MIGSAISHMGDLAITVVDFPIGFTSGEMEINPTCGVFEGNESVYLGTEIDKVTYDREGCAGVKLDSNNYGGWEILRFYQKWRGNAFLPRHAHL